MTLAVANDVVESAQALVLELEKSAPAEKSKEWYAINNLNGFIEDVQKAGSKQDLLNASDILSRFAVDSLDWGSSLMKSITGICESGRKCARQLA